MDLFFTLLTFFAITSIAVFFSLKYKILPSISPLVSVCFAMVFVSVISCFGLVKLGGYIYFAIALGAFLYVITKKREDIKKVITPGFVFFAVSSIFVIFLFAYKKPLFTSWDEFSFWGTSIKLVKVSGEMYTTAEIGWSWAATQKPGLIMLGYLFEFFGKFVEWRAIVGIDILMFSVVSAVIACFENKDWHKAVPFALAAFLTPFAFSLYTVIPMPSYVYMSVLADVPLGMLFGGLLCIYYSSREKTQNLWAVMLALAALTFVKDTAFPIAMVAAGIIAVDILLCQNNVQFFGLKNIYAKLCKMAMVFFAPIVAFLFWVKYLALAVGVDSTGNVGGSDEMSMLQMLLEGIKQFLGIGVTEKFADVMGRMYNAYFDISLTVLGSGFKVSIIILAIIVLAIICAKEKSHKISCAIYAVLSTAGFAVYYIFIGFCYVFVFKQAEAQYLMSYERYIYPYYIGWFISSVMLLAISVKKNSEKTYGLGRMFVYLLVAVMAFRLSNILTVGKTFIDFDNGFLYERRVQIEKVQGIKEYIPQEEKSKIFFIGQGGDGDSWFKYSSEMLPLQLDYSFGGGTICLPQDIEEGTAYYIRITHSELLKYLKENDCGYIFVETSDEYLKNGFGDLFSDNLEGCKDGVSMLYKVKNDTFVAIGEV